MARGPFEPVDALGSYPSRLRIEPVRGPIYVAHTRAREVLDLETFERVGVSTVGYGVDALADCGH
jgi:hypothetical protein